MDFAAYCRRSCIPRCHREHFPHIRRYDLKKSELKPWKKKCWCIAPKQDASFVAAIEDILDLYALAPDPAHPLVCLDEFSKQLLSQPSQPIPMSSAKPVREDYEYCREGTATGFMISLPHKGVRHVYYSPTAKRKSVDFAHHLDHLLHELLPEVKKVRLVMDNLNTHKTASLYEAFSPDKHEQCASDLRLIILRNMGSWLNMAEIEIGNLINSGLKGRIPNMKEMKIQTEAFFERANMNPSPIKWLSNTQNARTKLKHLYPTI